MLSRLFILTTVTIIVLGFVKFSSRLLVSWVFEERNPVSKTPKSMYALLASIWLTSYVATAVIFIRVLPLIIRVLGP